MASSFQSRKAAAVVVLMLLDSEEKSRRKQKYRRVWVRGWIARRQELGGFHRIVRVVHARYEHDYKEYTRHEDGCGPGMWSILIASFLCFVFSFDWLKLERCVTLLHVMSQIVDTR